MRYILAAALALGIMTGVTACNEAQRKAAVDGAKDGGSGAPATPPSGWDNFAVYLAAYAAGTMSKELLRAGKNKFFKGHVG